MNTECKTIEINGRLVGDRQPCFVIAEIGSNHNQDWKLALELIDAAAEAGVNAVKFQTFKAIEHVSSKAKTPSYLNTTTKLQDIIKSLELNREWHEPLNEYCKKKGVIFFSSPCDYAAVDELNMIGIPSYKVASFDLPDTDLIRYIAKTGKPIILSTGLADWMDIQRAIDVCHSENNENIVFLQCTSLYPAPAELSNLRAISSMRSAYNVLTGYSDHTIGDIIPCAAVAYGACMLEKHITLDRTLPGPDHPFAMEPEELSLMVKRIRMIEAALGDGIKNGPRPEEVEMAELVMRSLHAKCDIKSGEVITKEMLIIKRPGNGIPPYLREHVIGRPAKFSIEKDTAITWNMI